MIELIQLCGELLRTCAQNATRSDPAKETGFKILPPKVAQHCSDPAEGWRSGWRANSGHISTRYLLVGFYVWGREQIEVIAALTSQLVPLGRDIVCIREKHRLRFGIQKQFVVFAIWPWSWQDLDPMAHPQ